LLSFTSINMQLFVRGSQAVHALSAASLEDLRAQLAHLEGGEDFSLTAGGPPVDDQTDLTTLNGATLDLVFGLKGGKVHGSLARAGKVRGQTPKVEAQEKKKKKTGRAKRRIQYNRRFVNVVPTFGRKRGPNANS